jgi:hypothetical protein
MENIGKCPISCPLTAPFWNRKIASTNALANTL